MFNVILVFRKLRCVVGVPDFQVELYLEYVLLLIYLQILEYILKKPQGGNNTLFR